MPKKCSNSDISVIKFGAESSVEFSIGMSNCSCAFGETYDTGK